MLVSFRCVLLLVRLLVVASLRVGGRCGPRDRDRDRGCVTPFNHNDKRVLQVILHMPILFKPVVVIRLRGAGNNPNHDRNYNDIPYLTKRNFQWNCLPTIDFNERVLNLLNNGLGSVSIKSGTLLATVRETDPGGRLGNPMRAVWVAV